MKAKVVIALYAYVQFRKLAEVCLLMSGPVLWAGGQLVQSGCIHGMKLSYPMQWALEPKLATE